MADTEPQKYEHSDVEARAVWMFAGTVAALAVVGAIVAIATFWLMAAREGRGYPTFIARPERTQTPPQPRLQVAPPQDLGELRALEDAQLHRYAWIDRQAGIAAIPIERAMELVVQKGLKVSEAAGKDSGRDVKEP